jgi:hypothetical protein
MSYLRTSDLAKAVGAHPNTVRRYVDRGILPPVERSPSGYRRFTQRHLDCMRVARQVYCNQYLGTAIFQSGCIVGPPSARPGARPDLPTAIWRSCAERAQADAAAGVERWAFGPSAGRRPPLQIGRVARLRRFLTSCATGTVTETDIPRDPLAATGAMGAEISRLRVIRMLSRAGHGGHPAHADSARPWRDDRPAPCARYAAPQKTRLA